LSDLRRNSTASSTNTNSKNQVDEWIRLSQCQARLRPKPLVHPDRERAAEAIRTKGGIPLRKPRVNDLSDKLTKKGENVRCNLSCFFLAAAKTFFLPEYLVDAATLTSVVFDKKI
jgi:hypothetical protein